MAKNHDLKLWYEQPARCWNEALPIGNGRLGAMIYGKTDEELISLNEDTLWSGHPRNLNPKNKKKYLIEAMELSKNKKYKETQLLIEKQLTSGWTESYMPLGDLILKFKHNGNVERFNRSLNLTTAVAEVEYSVGKINFKREVFASSPDNVIVIKISSDKAQSINFTLGFQSQLKSTVSVKGEFLVLNGEAPSHVEPSYCGECENPVSYSDKDTERGMLFAAMAKVKVDDCGGNVIYSGSSITVENANSAVILISAHTSFKGYDVQPFVNDNDYEKLCLENIQCSIAKSYESTLSAHLSDYKSYFDRVYLNLGKSEYSTLPTDKRLYHFQEEQNDPALYTLLFQYGRYLLISSSRECTQPANLQGIWNSEVRPPWSSNYTVNINTEMNYWPAFTCALGELQQPLVKMIKEISAVGKITAQEMYGAKGFVLHHNTDLWRLTSPVGNQSQGCAGFAYWNLSAGWLCRHLFDQYEYTLDVEFLKNTAYPIMKSASEFLLDIMTTDKDGYFIICPSTSPENSFIYEGKICNVSETTTMSMTITKELFKNCIKSCEILDCDHDFESKLKYAVEKLYPYKIGSKGQLLEWNDEYEENEINHRHISHLYGLHPGNEITIEETPELAEACRNSLNRRGDEGTGWSMAWKINQWARLLDGDRSLKLLNTQLKLAECNKDDFTTVADGTYINMFDACPPFQIDGNFGATSGIAEMLLQSRNNKIFILPALPSAWEKGCVQGLCAKGLIKVDIKWDNHGIKAELLSEIDQTIMVAIKDLDLSTVILKSGIPKSLYR